MAGCNKVGLRTVTETIGPFVNKFLKVVANDNPGNLITSPLSAQVVLAMAAYGADGQTATQIQSAILIPSDDKIGQSGYQSIIEFLAAPKGVELHLANMMYTIGVAVKPAYKELTATKFLSPSQEVDFNDAKSAASIINTWCEKQTNNRIKNVITSDDLSPETNLMVVVSAVYFKGGWENKFNPSFTTERPFHVSGQSMNNIPTMYIKNELRFGDLPELHAKFIEIPYQGREFSMIIILPYKIDGLSTVLDNLHRVNLSQSLQQQKPREVKLYLPKFKIESTLDLQAPLENLGIIDMFQSRAGFFNVADIPLRISKVVQKAFIEVNEEGSDAAAATVLALHLYSSNRTAVFDANHPFYYEIRSASLDVPLFAGLFTDQE